MLELETLKDIAEGIMFGGKVTEDRILKYWEYRKGKTIEDLKKAIQKGVKAGNYKVEREVEWIEVYLKDVLKKRRDTTNDQQRNDC